jgi:type I restriction enzyme, R subunit
MKLLIVVSKLLTGFDAPSCTYIYLDHELRDHNLFQAICRTNRLDGDDKDYGYIVDFKQLFGHVQETIAVYSSDELDTDQGNGGDNNIHLKQTLQEGRQQLDDALQVLDYLCHPVLPPRELEQYLLYFCGHASNPQSLTDTEALRVSFYKAVAQLTRAYAELVQDLIPAGYTEAQAATLHKQVRFYADLRSAMKKHAGEELDIKPYEADMRHLLNTYVQADAPIPLSGSNDLSLLEMIVQTGIHDAIAKQLNAKGQLSNNAVAEGIIHNVRHTIARTQLTDPRFYAEMSALLADLIQQNRDDAAAYADFLRQAQELVVKLMAGQSLQGIPAVLHGNKEAIVLFRHLDTLPCTSFQCPSDDEAKASLVLKIDQTMRQAAPAGWSGDQTKERVVQSRLYELLNKDMETTSALFDLIQHQQGYQ